VRFSRLGTAPEKNIYEHGMMWVKIVAKCKLDVLFEGVAVQQA